MAGLLRDMLAYAEEVWEWGEEAQALPALLLLHERLALVDKLV